FSSCTPVTLGYAQSQAGMLVSDSCATGSGQPAAWFLLRAGANLVQFNGGFSGSVQSAFPLGGELTDLIGAIPLYPFFADDATALFPSGSDLVLAVRVTGAAPGQRGSYTLSTDSASFRQ